VPNEHAENAGTRKRQNPEEPPALDPLENAIDVKLPFALTGPKNAAGKAVFYMAKVVPDILRLMRLSVLMSRTKKTHELLSGLGNAN
jgi:hypothetical protein